MSIGDDLRVSGLAEDRAQAGDRRNAAADQVAEHIPGAHRWELVHIADEQQLRARDATP